MPMLTSAACGCASAWGEAWADVRLVEHRVHYDEFLVYFSGVSIEAALCRRNLVVCLMRIKSARRTASPALGRTLTVLSNTVDIGVHLSC
jgi:hypothetical protein